MKKTLEYLLTQLVSHPEDLKIEEKTEERGDILIVHANSEDLGRIIGKSGRIIRAIRDLIKIIAAKKGTFIDVVLAEDEMYNPESNKPKEA